MLANTLPTMIQTQPLPRFTTAALAVVALSITIGCVAAAEPAAAAPVASACQGVPRTTTEFDGVPGPVFSKTWNAQVQYF